MTSSENFFMKRVRTITEEEDASGNKIVVIKGEAVKQDNSEVVENE